MEAERLLNCLSLGFSQGKAGDDSGRVSAPHSFLTVYRFTRTYSPHSPPWPGLLLLLFLLLLLLPLFLLLSLYN
jgi:hypothetical protein